VCRDETCITGSMARGGLGRALEVSVPAHLAAALQSELLEATHGAQ
jgi:hypothetical protein